MFDFIKRAGIVAATMALAAPVWADDLPTIRAAVLKIGTVNWELKTIEANGFDEKHGFNLEIAPLCRQWRDPRCG